MQSLHSAAHRWPLTCSDYRTVSFFPPLSKKKNVFFTQFWLLQHTFSCTLKCPRGCRKVFHSGGPNFTYYKVSVLGNIPKSNGDRLSGRRGEKTLRRRFMWTWILIGPRARHSALSAVTQSWEKPEATSNLFVLFLVFSASCQKVGMWRCVFLAALFAVGFGFMTGGLMDIDSHDAGVLDALNYAVRKHNNRSNDMYVSQVTEVIGAQAQVGNFWSLIL